MVMMPNLSMFVLMMIGAILPSARGDPCSGYIPKEQDWRSVSGTAQINHCDNGEFEAGKWYAFKVNGIYSNIPTECIKNNKCGAQIALRLDLNQSLPVEGKVIEASLCGSYNILGQYDCCVLRTPVRISVCSGVTVYQFPTPPVDRCSVAICVKDPSEPQLPRSLIARTGDIHEDESNTTASAATTLVVDTSEIPEDTTPVDVTVSDQSTETLMSASTTNPTNPTPSDLTDADTPVTDLPGDVSTTANPIITESQSSEIPITAPTESTTDPSVMSTEEITIDNAPPMDLQQSTTDEPSESTTESMDKTSDKITDTTEVFDDNTTSGPPPPDTSDETPTPSLDAHSTSHYGDGSGELHDSLTASGDTVYVPTPQSSITDEVVENVTESVSVRTSGATQGHESTDETSSTVTPPGDTSEAGRTGPPHDEPPYDEPLSTLMSEISTTDGTSSENLSNGETATNTITTASLSSTWTPQTPQLLTTTARSSAPDYNDLILIEVIRFVFKGNHSSIYFSSDVYRYLESFLSRAVKEYKPDSVSHWNYTLTNLYHPVLLDNMTYVDVRIQHTVKEEIIIVFNKLKLENFLAAHGNLTLIAKCRASENCEMEGPHASTQSVFERNAPVFITLIVICSICLIVLLVIACYLKCCRTGVYVAQDGDGTNLADRRRYFNVNPSPFTDEQIMKDEVAMEKGEKQDKVDNSSCNGSDLVGGESNTWVIPLDDAPVTSPVLSNEDTKL